MKCDACSSSHLEQKRYDPAQVVKTQDGNFCPEHYRAYKRGKAIPREVRMVCCGNCGESVPPSSRCIRCGNTLTSDGSVLRIGGHPDC